jgi:hypothetical protein
MSDNTKKPPPTKDLTGIIQYAKKMQDSGQAPEMPKGSIMEEVPIEKIDDFESLDDYAAANPAPEPLAEPSFDPSTDDSNTTPPAEPGISLEGFDTTPGSDTPNLELANFEAEANPISTATSGGGGGGGGGGQENTNEAPLEENLFPESGFETSEFPSSGDFPVSPDSNDSSSSVNEFETSQPSGDMPPSDAFHAGEIPNSEANSNDFGNPSASNPDDLNAPNFGAEVTSSSHKPTPKLDQTNPKNSVSSSNSVPGSVPSSVSGALPASPAQPKPPKAEPSEKLAFKKDSPSAPAHALDNVKKYSEQLPTTKSAVPASFPFSILIRGELRPEEKEKLLSLIEDHQMGFRLIDLEPQLASGRILIPRISEYAGILIIQALRGTRAEMKLGTSDSIFSTAETHDSEEENFSSNVDEQTTSYSSDLSHPAESIPVTPMDRLPGSPKLILIDTITANAALKSTVVEAEHSSAFQEIVEALQREVKYKAFRKGATAVLNFKIQINYLSSPTHYRILAMGSAVKPANQASIQTPPTDALEAKNEHKL